MVNSTQKNKLIVGIGEVFFDILPDSRKLGGAPVDFLRNAIAPGVQGNLVSAIGADDLGREVITELNKFKIKPVLSITPYPTGRVLVFNNPLNGYSAHILENAAWDYIPFNSKAESCIKKADAIYFDTIALRKPYSRGTILDLIDVADPQAYRFFDINLRHQYYNKEVIQQLIERANILKINTEELKTLKTLFQLTGSNEDLCLTLQNQYNLQYIILTNTAKESFIWGKKGLTTVKNSKLQQIFAYGAGNAFAGAFMSAILNGKSQQDAHEIANNAAVEVCRLKKE